MNEVFYLRQNHYNLRSFDVFAADNCVFIMSDTRLEWIYTL